LAQAADPLALRLDVGLPDSVSLLDRHDLDNYLFPLVTEVTRRTGRTIASAWATKQHSADSYVQVGTAIPTGDPSTPIAFEVSTSVSAQTVAYKRAIRDQVTGPVLADAGIALQLGFVMGPQRVWTNLWKPTIDGLGRVLGDGSSEWNVRDGRIIELGMHCVVVPDLGQRVIVAVCAAPAGR
jgi:hypothetical protein